MSSTLSSFTEKSPPGKPSISSLADSTKTLSPSHDIAVAGAAPSGAGAVDNLKQLNKSHTLSDSSSATKMVSDMTQESSSAPQQLIKVIEGILVILKQFFFEKGASKRNDVQKLVKRLESLLDSFIKPCDQTELRLRLSLKTKFDDVFEKLHAMQQQGKFSAFIKKTDREISMLVKEVGDALADYQTVLQQAIYQKIVESGDMTWLDRLSYTKDASHLCGNRKRCLSGTRIDLLDAIDAWVEDSDPNALRLYWLGGMAGTGKTTIAQTVAERMFEMWLLGASFFCSRDSIDRGELQQIFPTLSFQLACRFPDFRSYLIDVIKSNPDVARYSLTEQFQRLLFEPLKKSKLQTAMIIDALDECIDNEPTSAILSVLSKYIDDLPLVKFFITGRPEPRIEAGFRMRSLRPHTVTVMLHELESSLVDQDITTFFKTRFSQLVETRRYLRFDDRWPSDDDIAVLVRKCATLFIYADTTFRFINSDFESPVKLLRLIVNLPDSSSNEALQSVDRLYTQILQFGFKNVANTRAAVVFEQFKTVIGTIVVSIEPLSAKSIASLLNLEPSDVLVSLRFLRSLFIVPDQKSGLPIRVLHRSFRDYITDDTRCNDNRFYVDSAVRHGAMALSCLELMNKRLKKNICELPRYAKNAEVNDLRERKEKFIGATLEYACEFWADHLKMATTEDKDLVAKTMDSLVRFFKFNSVPWLEILSILGKLKVAVHALYKIKQWISALHCDTQEIRDMCQDCTRFVLHFFDIIQESSQHIYHSTLPWCPESSLIRATYGRPALLASEVNIVRGLEHAWGSCIRTIQIRDNIRAMAISRREDMIAVGDKSGRCHIFEATSGSIITVLEVSDEMYCVSFSADSSLLASGDKSGDIRVWDVQTGICKVLFQGGKDNGVNSVSFASNGMLLASGTMDGKVRIWDVTSEGPLKHTLEGHTGPVLSLCWSDAGSKVLSASQDKSMKIWDACTRKCLHTIQVEDNILNVAWSPDGSKIGLSTEYCIRIYNARTYNPLTTVKVPGFCPGPFDFSPKGDNLIYSSSTKLTGHSVVVRNLNLGVDVSRFVGHTFSICSVSFSSSGTMVVSAAYDNLVKVWPFKSGENGSDHEQDLTIRPFETSAFSPDGRLIATATENVQEVQLRDSSILSHIGTLIIDSDLPSGFQYPLLRFSPDSSLVACRINSVSIRIWNVDTRAIVSDFGDDTTSFDDFCFSPDGDRIVTYLRKPFLRFIDDEGKYHEASRPIQLWDVLKGKSIASFHFSEEFCIDRMSFFADGSGIQITPKDCGYYDKREPIMLDIILSVSVDPASSPFEFVKSSKDSPAVILDHREYASYKFADGLDRIIDSKNRSVCLIPPDQRPKHSWDAIDAKVAWSNSKGLVVLDFSRVK